MNRGWSGVVNRFLEHGDHWECLASPEYREKIIPKGVGRWSLASFVRHQNTMLVVDGSL
jgi:hypothetical protein